MRPSKTLVTLWFVTAAQPRTVMEAEPHADRGFARKYLAQYNPAWPLTHIGDFDMARSAAPSDNEFYIGGYPGLSVVQAVFNDTTELSQLDERYRTLVNSADVYAIARAADDGGSPEFGAFAHWSGGTLKRSFAATRETVFEDIGLPYAFEMPFWEGNTPSTGIQLPFRPTELARAAEDNWLGFSVRDSGFDIPVTAFAVDGRPEAKTATEHVTPTPAPHNVAVYESEQGYDDYSESLVSPEKAKTNRELAEAVAVAVKRSILSGALKLRGAAGAIGDEVRRRARNTDRR